MQIRTLTAERRAISGTKAMRKERANGRMPGVLYGRGQDNVNLLFSSKDIENIVKDAAHVVQLHFGDEPQYALVRALQRDFLGDAIQHIDFVRIDLSEKVRLRIPLSFLGTPKGATHGGLLEVSHGDIETMCPADRIPRYIEVEVTNMEVGDQLTVKDLNLPEGSETILGPDVVVVKCAQARRAAALEAAATAPAPGKPAAGAKAEAKPAEKAKK
jgi:large subunit ribosomal protein L25